MRVHCERCSSEYPPDPGAGAETCPDCGFHPEADPERFGPYRLLGLLGRGAAGIVFRARRDGHASVALKVLSAARPDLAAQFEREGSIAARLSHPNIVGVRDSGTAEDRRYIAFEFVPGQSLAALIRDRSVDAPGAARIAESAARALLHAHRCGVIHRDITPGNILVTPSGVPKLTDFGLAVADDHPGEFRRSGVTAGTPVYMSPEQAAGMHDLVDARSDVYSLGAVLYEALGGRPPFTGRSVLEILRKVREEEPPPLQGVDPGLGALVARAMDKNPARRHPSMKELAGELRRWLDRRPPGDLRYLGSPPSGEGEGDDEGIGCGTGGFSPPL